ncbi:MAG: hypothetical protein U0031_00485 [Thermomicrobiales bacterium]
MSDERNPLTTAFGATFSRHYLIAVIHDGATADSTCAALRAAGFADGNVVVCAGDVFVKNWNEHFAHRGLLERALDLFPSEERAAVEEYLEEAGNGASFLLVHTPDRAGRDQAREVIVAHTGHAMRYFDDRTIVDLG